MKSSVIDQDDQVSDSGDDEQSDETVDAEISEEDADVIKGNRVTRHDSGEAVVVLDSKTRNPPSFLPENAQVCVEIDVNRPKEKGQPVMEGTQIRSAQQPATKVTGQAPEPGFKSAGSQASKPSCTEVMNSVAITSELLSPCQYRCNLQHVLPKQQGDRGDVQGGDARLSGASDGRGSPTS